MEDITLKIKEKLQKGEVVNLKIKVIANAKINSLEEYTDEILKLRINKPAVDGKANKAIIEYLSVQFDVPKSNIIILKGEKNSLKDLLINPKSHII
ncbi:TPA: DUF167 domain-containing protein [Candidatus Galligastranaerophilus intestinigallinarum]|nr:DUF167 domain-containing protein [Candidatus Galligastranaerophilus intestinigallinarum]